MNGGKKVSPKEVPDGVKVYSMKEVETMGEENKTGKSGFSGEGSPRPPVKLVSPCWDVSALKARHCRQ